MKSLKVVDNKNANDEECMREQYVVNYLKSMIAIEEAIQPFNEQKKDLREEYIENNWLSKDEIWAAVRAYRIYMKGVDMTEIADMFDAIERQFGDQSDL